MSAYQVDKAHIATLAVFGQRTVAGRFGGLVGLANLLAQANADSMNARYPNDPTEAYVFKDEAAVHDSARLELIKPIVMMKAVKCLEYQSCEHEGWAGSDAALACRWLLDEGIRSLPGYDNADGWSIDDVAPAAFGTPGRQYSLTALMAGAYKGKAS